MIDNTRPPAGLLARVLALSGEERSACAWSFACFFSILCAYFLLRPVRDEMAILAGPENIPDLFLGTFIAVVVLVPVFGLITKHVPRRHFLPGIYGFAVLNLVAFYLAAGHPAIDPALAARAFFVWLSVFNFFLVSLFWSFMADLFSKEQARRLFGLIAGGGSAGAICGPLLTSVLIGHVAAQHLFLIAAGLLCFTIVAMLRLLAWAGNHAPDTALTGTKPIGGGILEGIWLVLRTPYLLGIAALISLGTFAGTAMYMYRAQTLQANFADSAMRTQIFGSMDLATNVLALLLQVLVARHAIRKLGVGTTLTILPLLSIAGFAILVSAPSVAAVVVFDVVRRSVNFGLNGPARENLFTVVATDAKYKAKNFLDVTLVRASDVVSSQSVRALQALASGFAPIALACATTCAVWAALALALGRQYRQRREVLLNSEARHGESH